MGEMKSRDGEKGCGDIFFWSYSPYTRSLPAVPSPPGSGKVLASVEGGSKESYV